MTLAKRVVITGASRGIGAALADLYRDRGDSVIGTSTTGSDSLVPLDLTGTPDFTALKEALGADPVDLLICNAGVYLDKGHDLDTGFPAAAWATTMAVNVAGPFLTTQALLPALRKSTAGRVAIISSAMGSQARAPGGSYVYRASKAGAANVARNLACDLAADAIAVGAYHLGWVQTDMGGSAADIDVTTSVNGLAARFDLLTPETTGTFETWDGQPVPF